LIPALAAALPRPGRWMVTLQRLLSLPMFATFLWLAWVVTRQAGPQGLTLLMLGTVCLALALTVRLLRPAALLMLLLLPFLHSATGTAALSLPGAEPYSATRLAQLRASGSPVFIDLTASWCVTCLLNERTTLMNRAVREGFAARHVHVLVGDWTNRNAEIARLLRDNNRDGVPFYLYYPPAGPPVTLPQILTPRIVLNLIGQSAGQPSAAQTLARGG
jgi:thiol:disulfide interchange protein DsbD